MTQIIGSLPNAIVGHQENICKNRNKSRLIETTRRSIVGTRTIIITCKPPPLFAVVVLPKNNGGIVTVTELYSIVPMPMVSEGISIHYSIVITLIIIVVGNKNIPSFVPLSVELSRESLGKIREKLRVRIYYLCVGPCKTEVGLDVVFDDSHVFY